METVAQMFASYRQAVLPLSAPPLQIDDCRKAFFAGVAAAVTALQNSPDDIGDEELERQVLGLLLEVQVLAHAVDVPHTAQVEG
jgi:hypothetical protein